MSHHIDNNRRPPLPLVQHCADLSFNHETSDIKKGPCTCKCNTGEVKPGKLDLIISQYEELMKAMHEAEAAFIAKAMELEDIAHETNATANTQSLMAAIYQSRQSAISHFNQIKDAIPEQAEGIKDYILSLIGEWTEEEIRAMFDDAEPTPAFPDNVEYGEYITIPNVIVDDDKFIVAKVWLDTDGFITFKKPESSNDLRTDDYFSLPNISVDSEGYIRRHASIDEMGYLTLGDAPQDEETPHSTFMDENGYILASVDSDGYIIINN